MMNLKLRSVDLNLLPVLRELLRTRNVTRASEVLNMSQSAVSEALRRLRMQFKDEILVRVGREMLPTHFASGLSEPVEQALADLERLLAAEPSFDPARIQRRFVIATADCVVLALGSGLTRALSEAAPGVSVQFVDLQYVEARDLELGRLDFLIRPMLPDEHCLSERVMLLYQEEWVYIARKGHPQVTRDSSLEALEDLTSIAFRPDPESPLRTLPHAERADLLRVPQFTTIPFIVETSDAIAVVQRDIAERLATMLNIQILDTRPKMTSTPVHARWADIHENDPEHRWFRELIAQIAADHRRSTDAVRLSAARQAPLGVVEGVAA